MTAAAIANDWYGRRPRRRRIATLTTLLEALVVLDPTTHAWTLVETRSLSRRDRGPFSWTDISAVANQQREFEK
jgi:hypothetical protein